MENEEYQIPMQVGHSRRLRFRLAPVSKKIMNADADWLDDAELCIDNITAHELLLPYIEMFFTDAFQFHNELNLMPFSAAGRMADEIRADVMKMKKDFDDPSLDRIRPHIALDLIVPPEVYSSNYVLASAFEKNEAVRKHLKTVTDFYGKVTDWIDQSIKKYEPLDFHDFAVTAPV